MHSVVVTERARADLDRLHAFIARKSARSAQRAVQRIIEGIDLLALFPRSGVVVKGAVRSAFIRFGRSGYEVRYKIDADVVIITRIWHGKEKRRSSVYSRAYPYSVRSSIISRAIAPSWLRTLLASRSAE